MEENIPEKLNPAAESLQKPPLEKHKQNLLKNKWLVVGCGLLVLALIAIFGYSLVASNSKKAEVTSVYPSPSIHSSPSASPSIDKIPIAPSTEPIGASSLIKVDLTKNMQCRQFGAIVYMKSIESNNTYMIINNTSNPQYESSKNAIAEIRTFLEGQITPELYQEITAWQAPFNYKCIGAPTDFFIKEIKGVNYLNTDSSRAFVLFAWLKDWQATQLIVLAKKGNDLIKLSTNLNEELIDSGKYCNSTFGVYEPGSSHPEWDKCYKGRLPTDISLDNVASQEANKLIALFAIK